MTADPPRPAAERVTPPTEQPGPPPLPGSADPEGISPALPALPAEQAVEDDDWEGVSLEELGAAYARVIADAELPGEPAADRAGEAAGATNLQASVPAAAPREIPPPEEGEGEEGPVTPEAIIEAALFVGHPENRPIAAAELAGMMRDVTEDEVHRIVDHLNQSYRGAGQAVRIHSQEAGFQLGLCESLETVRRAFYGKVREAHLSHAAVEVLALVAYQPGIDAQRVQDQRGKDSGPLLNQLVRRRLLEIRRQPPAEGGRPVATYYPTERFLNLFELSSLEDLPLVDEADVSPQPTPPPDYKKNPPGR